MSNIFESLPPNLTEEVFEVLAKSETTTIERIISRGHTSPATGWYDQERHEWVMVLQGAAVVEFEQGKSVRLEVGHYITIPAHTKHRVAWTAPDTETLWLAVHYE